MSSRFLAVAAVAAVGVASLAGGTAAASAGARAAALSRHAWGKAIEVSGIAALNHGGNASIASVSCASAGECSAGGPTAGGDGAFVVSET